MKKSLLFLGMLALGLANAQQTTSSTTSTTPTTNGKVGVNTETPTRTLDVNGDLRVRTMETANFEGLMVSETIKDESDPNNIIIKESNVVRKAEIKGKILLINTPITGSELKISRTPTNDQNKIFDRFAPGNDRWIKLPVVPANATQYLKLSADGTYYEVLKSGFYNIGIKYVVNVQDPASDTFDGNYGFVYVALTARTKASDPNTGAMRVEATKKIFKGARSSRGILEDGQADNNITANNLTNIFANGSAFIPAGGRIAVVVFSNHMASVVENDEGLDRITLSPDNLSHLTIIANLQ